MADRLSPDSERSTTPRRRSHALLAGLAALALVAGACGGGGDGDVEITYRQLAFFPAYDVVPGVPSTPGANGAYYLYRITGLDNQSGSPFTLNPARFVAEHEQDSKEHAAHEAQLLGDQVLESTTVESGDSVEDLGCIVMVVRVDEEGDGFGNFGGTVTSVDLEYEENVSGNAQTERDQGNTGFPILEPANAETVQRACEEGAS